MKKTLLLIAVAAICFVRCSTVEQKPDREIVSIYYDDEILKEARAAVQSKDKAIMPAYNALKEYTDAEYLNMEPMFIADGKTRIAGSMDPRDYISLSPYWWPDPSKPNGVPYIRKDGERNPEVYEYVDREASNLFGKAVESLAVTYYLSGEEKYAEQAAKMIRKWFTDKRFGMNPHMTYAQTVPGMESIRGTGIIDARRFITGINAAMIIADSDAWTAEDEHELKRWTNYLRYWLEHTTFGRMEAVSGNNHALWFETLRQICVFYSGDFDYLREVMADQLDNIGEQIEADGTMPRELARTLSLHYTTFALEALTLSNNMGKKAGIDVTGYQAPNGRSVSTAIDYALPYFKNPSSWPHQQINPYNTSRAAAVLYQAGRSLNNQTYLDAAASIGYGYDQDGTSEEMVSLISDVLYYKL